MSSTTKIKIGTSEISLDHFQHEPQKYAHAVLLAKNTVGHANCLCNKDCPRLVIARRAGRYYVAGWPNEGHLHHPGCDFFKNESGGSGLDSYSQEALQKRGDGSFSIRLNQPLSLELGAPTRPPSGARTKADSKSTSRRSSTLLGLLHYLWEESNLNRWFPGWRRDWYLARNHLLATTSKGEIAGRSMSEAVYVVPKFSTNAAQEIKRSWDTWSVPLLRSAMGATPAKLKNSKSITRIHTGMILGRIKAVERTDRGYIIKLKDHAYPIYAKHALIEKLEKRFGRFTAHIEQNQGECIVLALLMPHEKGYFSLIDAGIMYTSAALIPIESNHELKVADALRLADRHFSKPLLYDSSDEEFPDFVLYDTARSKTIMEIYGMVGNQAYDNRKKEKQEVYRKAGADLWVWDLTKSKDMPPLPPVR